MGTADTGPTARPMDWDESFAEVVRKGVGASEVDGDADASLAESEEEHTFVVPTISPLLARAVYGDALRIISPYRRNTRHDPGMSEKHGALLLPLTAADVQQSQRGVV
eukprot:409343-Pyramimonas_sp.AAC.1